MYTYICAEAFFLGGGGGGGGGGAFIYICPPSGGCATTPLAHTTQSFRASTGTRVSARLKFDTVTVPRLDCGDSKRAFVVAYKMAGWLISGNNCSLYVMVLFFT